MNDEPDDGNPAAPLAPRPEPAPPRRSPAPPRRRSHPLLPPEGKPCTVCGDQATAWKAGSALCARHKTVVDRLNNAGWDNAVERARRLHETWGGRP